MNTTFVLASWFPKNKIHFESLCRNPNAVEMVEEIIDNLIQTNILPVKIKIKWSNIAENPNAFCILQKHILNFEITENHKYFNEDYNTKFDFLSKIASNHNPEIFDTFMKPILTKYFDTIHTPPDLAQVIKENINWINLSSNPNAIEFIKEKLIYEPNGNCELFDFEWEGLSANPHPEAIEILRRNPELINLDVLMKNPSAVGLLQELNIGPDWDEFSGNPSQEAIDLIIERFNNDLLEIQEHCDIEELASNPFGLKIIEEMVAKDLLNFETIYIALSKNPNAKHILSRPETLRYIDNSWYSTEFYKNLSANPCIFDEITINLK